MSSYYKHTKTESIQVPYSFRCEQCLKDSGTQNAQIFVQAEINSNFKHLSERKQEKLAAMAHTKLISKVTNTFRNAMEKQIYSSVFKDACPYCNAPQSWAISAAKKDLFSAPAILAVFGLLLGVGCFFFLENDDRLSIAVASTGICLVIAAVMLIFQLVRFGRKKRRTAAALQQNKPVIEWSAVQHLLNEK